MFIKRNKKESDPSRERVKQVSFEKFLEDEYLQNEYLVPSFLDIKLKDLAIKLAQLEGFRGLVNVGGTAIGSYVWRNKDRVKPASDLDYYLIGFGQLDLTASSEIIQAGMSEVGLPLDGVLNGYNVANYLDLDDIDGVIDRGDSPLLALPFQSMYSNNPISIQKHVLASILKRSDSQEVWGVIGDFHVQSLSLHHGTFTEDDNVLIMDNYYPKKIEKFGLPLAPEEMLAKLDGR
ncbi:hypothetical protein EOL96_05730 [Candidatus Saccharibacteria bacterium]|nr:hypothetical protein [Candidatus Saccharibacteria bacterium]